MIKKIFKGFLVVVVCFLVGFSVGRCSSSNSGETNEIIHNKKPIRYEDGEYISSNIGSIAEISHMEPYNEDGQIGAYYDSQGEGYYLFNEEIEFNILENPDSYPATYYFTFENDIDEPYNDIYIYAEWDVDAGYIYIEPTEQLKNGLYTLSFQVDFEYRQNYDRYFVYNIMLNEGNYTEYEPLDKIYGSNVSLGMFRFATLQSAIFEDGELLNSTIEPLKYNIIDNGFIATDWDLKEDRVEYAIICDFGLNGFNAEAYDRINILNGSKNDYRAFLGFGQRIYIDFSDYTYILNGADISNTVSYINLKKLMDSHGTTIYKIYFIGYGDDYLPGGLSSNSGYTDGYTDGYKAGTGDGFHKGYDMGFINGEETGYNKGYIDGEAYGYTNSQGALGIVKSVLSFISVFTALEILPGIKIIYLLGLVVMVSVFKWIMGLFGGGK